jgi:hypothetical protein
MLALLVAKEHYCEIDLHHPIPKVFEHGLEALEEIEATELDRPTVAWGPDWAIQTKGVREFNINYRSRKRYDTYLAERGSLRIGFSFRDQIW